MSADAKFVRRVLDSCESALVDQDFRKLRLHSVVYDVNKDFLGWVGLNYGHEKSGVRINPFVGIHCIPLMRMIEELSGSKYQLGRYATFAVHLGEIDSSFHPFDFLSDDEIDAKAEHLASELRRVAIPFMGAYGTYEALLPILMRRVPELGGFPQRVAACLYLAGRKKDALQFVEERRNEYATDEEIVRSSFDRFALPFLRLLSEQE